MLWARYDSAAMIRLPMFHFSPVSGREIRQVLWQGPSTLVSYLMAPNEDYPVNAWLYVCRDQSYSLDRLSKEARRDARRAERRLRIEPIEWRTLLDHGLAAYSDTFARTGFVDGTSKQFRQHIQNFSRNPAHYALGAWKDDTLVAFMTLVVVDDWVEIVGSYSRTADRETCPNNGLAHQVLSYFLAERGFRTVSYGINSIEEGSHTTGLHFYKTKVGFEAHPVHRVFFLHPFLRPMANRVTLWAVNMALRLKRGNRRLNKAHAILALCVEKTAARIAGYEARA
jgi:hypothetical protein